MCTLLFEAWADEQNIEFLQVKVAVKVLISDNKNTKWLCKLIFTCNQNLVLLSISLIYVPPNAVPLTSTGDKMTYHTCESSLCNYTMNVIIVPMTFL